MKKQKKGFTLLEMLIVLSLIGILLPATFTILYNILNQQLRLYKLTETKRQGDYILTYIKDTIIRDAISIERDPPPLGGATTGACTSISNPSFTSYSSYDGQDMYFVHRSSATGPRSVFRFYLNGTNIRYHRDALWSQLNTSQFLIEPTSFTISCYRKADRILPLVSFSFRITYNDSESANPAKRTSLVYSSQVRLRNR